MFILLLADRFRIPQISSVSLAVVFIYFFKATWEIQAKANVAWEVYKEFREICEKSEAF
jgi:hypothetical protein